MFVKYSIFCITDYACSGVWFQIFELGDQLRRIIILSAS